MKNTTNNKINEQLSLGLPGAMHYNFAHPWDGPGIHLVGGQGHFVVDADNNEYLDFFSKFGALFLGHTNERYINYLADKIKTSLTAVDHFGENEDRIIKKILSAVPGAEQVRFTLSGTEAVQNAFRAARAFTGKDKIVRFDGNYHGSSDTILGGVSTPLNYTPKEQKGDPRGTRGRASHSFDATLLLPWNDWGACEKILDERDDIAAFIIEPICINGGGLIPDEIFLNKLKVASKEKGFLIIFDEVITGFRINYGSVQDQVGIRPDIWIFGKAIGGGSLPVSCFMASDEIMGQFAMKRTTHGGTFNGYPLGLYAVDITLDILAEPKVYVNTREKAKKLQELILGAAIAESVELTIQGDLLAMNLHASALPIYSPSDWTSEIKQKELIIRQSFMRHGIIIAPPCRIYPTIALNDKVLGIVENKINVIFKDVRADYKRAGYEK